jgi:hypothetical protein
LPVCICRQQVAAIYAAAALQVPNIRASMLARTDWAELAKAMKRGWLAPGAASEATQARMKGLLEAFNFMVDSSMVADPLEAAKAEGAAKENVAAQQPVKLVLYMRGASGVMEPWDDVQLSFDTAAETASVTLKVGCAASFS